MTVSAPFDMLFRTLYPQVFHVVQSQLWQNMWSKTLPGLDRQSFAGPGREVFYVSVWLDCNSGGGVMQVVSAREQRKLCGAIDKENSSHTYSSLITMALGWPLVFWQKYSL